MPAPSPTAAAPLDTIQVGRQPIFDRDLNVYAYELLYRDVNGHNSMTDGDHASSVTLLNAFLEIGLERIIGRHKAFINMTRHFFVDMPTLPFSSENVVLEVLEDVTVDAALLKGIAAKRDQGFALAMDDYQFQPQLAPILPLVDYIKVEIEPDGLDQLVQRMPELKATGVRLLAEKVETAEQFEQLAAMGFDLFQGYFFARPKLVQSDRLPENTTMLMRLLARLNDPAVPIEEVVHLVSQDASLSFKILRYVNSAAFGMRSKIDSIQRAVVLMGLQRIRAWASLFAMAGLEGRPMELLNMGIMRASLCETFAHRNGRGDPQIAYTVGLLSILDALLARPIDALLQDLPLGDEIKQAIINHAGIYGELLKFVLDIERNHWPTDSADGPNVAEITEAYAASSALGFETLELFTDQPDD